MKSGIKIVLDNTKRVQQSINAMVKSKVLVGIPSDKAERDDEDGEPSPLNNAEIGYIMENGAPEMNIPKRPFLIPGVKDAQPQTTAKFREASLAALSDDIPGFNRAIREAGQIAASSVENKIDNGPFAPLSDRTLRERARKQAVSGGTKADKQAARAALQTGNYSGINAKPLIDTGQLLRAIKYVIRKI